MFFSHDEEPQGISFGCRLKSQSTSQILPKVSPQNGKYQAKPQLCQNSRNQQVCLIVSPQTHTYIYIYIHIYIYTYNIRQTCQRFENVNFLYTICPSIRLPRSIYTGSILSRSVAHTYHVYIYVYIYVSISIYAVIIL